MGITECCATMPYFPILAMIVLCGGVGTMLVGAVVFAQIIDQYDTMMQRATDINNPVLLFMMVSAGLIIVFEMMIAYSIIQNKLRLRDIHCMRNSPNYGSCNGNKEIDAGGGSPVLATCCTCYSHLLLLLNWVTVILAIVMTVLGVALGTLIVLGAGICTLEFSYGVSPYSVTIDGPTMLADVYDTFRDTPFGFHMRDVNMSAGWINATICDDHRRTAAAGMTAVVGPALVTLSQVILVASFSTVYGIVRATAPLTSKGGESSASIDGGVKFNPNSFEYSAA